MTDPICNPLLQWNDWRIFPKNYRQQFCLVQSADQGGEGRLYPRLLHYDIQKKFWCEVDPSCCIPEWRKPIEWEIVRYWMPVEKIMDIAGWPNE